MKEVAILKLLDKSHSDYSEYLPTYLSDWVVISDDDYKTLVEGFRYIQYSGEGKLVLVEKPSQENTIRECLEKITLYKKQIEANKKSALEAAKKRENTTKKSKLELFEKLKKELGK